MCMCSGPPHINVFQYFPYFLFSRLFKYVTYVIARLVLNLEADQSFMALDDQADLSSPIWCRRYLRELVRLLEELVFVDIRDSGF